MSLLALDLGSKCGWAIRSLDGKLHSGFWSLVPSEKSPDNTRWLPLWRNLMRLHGEHRITVVAFELVMSHGRPGETKKAECPSCRRVIEMPMNAQNVLAAQVYGGLKAVLEMWCDFHDLPWHSVHVGTLKKFATGSGRATKRDMVSWAKLRWPEQRVHGDDQADALHILDWLEVEVLRRRVKQVIDAPGRMASS